MTKIKVEDLTIKEARALYAELGKMLAMMPYVHDYSAAPTFPQPHELTFGTITSSHPEKPMYATTNILDS